MPSDLNIKPLKRDEEGSDIKGKLTSLGLAGLGIGALAAIPGVRRLAAKGGQKAWTAAKGLGKGTWEMVKKIPGEGQDWTKKDERLFDLATKGTLGAGIAGAAFAASGIRGKRTLEKKRKVLTNIINDPDIVETDVDDAIEVYNVIDQFAPTIAENEPVSRSLVKQQLAIGQISPDFIHKIVETERRVKDTGRDAGSILKKIKDI